jgi:hypothetical protein
MFFMLRVTPAQWCVFTFGIRPYPRGSTNATTAIPLVVMSFFSARHLTIEAAK